MGATRRRLAITERDLVALAFAAEHRFVTAAQISVLLGATVAAADARLRVLADAGLVERDRPLAGRPALHQVTRAGLRAAGSDLGPPRPVDLSEHDHDHGLGWLMLHAVKGRFGPVRSVTGERRMRSQDARARTGAVSARHGVRRGGVGARGHQRLHHPDMTLVTAGGRRVAFELERTTKGRVRLEAILSAYAADRRIDAVVYLVERASTARAVRTAATRLGIDDLVSVWTVRLDPGPDRRGLVASGARARARSLPARGRAL